MTSILIGVPNGSGMFPAVMVQSLLQLHKPVPCAFMVVERQMVEMARNGIVREALSKGFSHLLFVDDDNPIPPDTLELMLSDDKDIVIAPILTRNPDKDGRHSLCAFKRLKVGGQKLYLEFDRVNGSDLVRVDAGGTGCMLIKRSVLESLYVKHGERIFERTRTVFDNPITYKGKEYTERTMSEDVQFCERAADAGYEIWMDTRIRPIHLGTQKAVQWQRGK